MRLWWSVYRCDTSKYVRISFPGDGRTWDLWVADKSAPIWEAVADIMASTPYLFRETAGGTYNCRPPSLHAYGLALDLNPSKNPFQYPVEHEYPLEFIERMEGIRANGKQALMWGGRFPASNPPDTMHWQINVAPSDCKNVTYDQEQEMPLTSDDIRRIWEYAVPDEDDGLGTRGAVHALRQAWGYARKASIDAAIARQLAQAAATGINLTAEQIDAIADAVSGEVADDLADNLADRLRD
jgi:hypothetical protein